MAEEILQTLLFALLFALHSAVVGLAACRAAHLASRAGHEVVGSGALFGIALALGFVIDLLLASALAFLGLLTPLVVVACGLLSGGWAILFIFRHRPSWSFHLPKAEWALLGLLFTIALARAFNVPGAFIDDTMYHLPVARIIAANHGLVVAPFIRYPLFPQAMEVLFAVGIMGAGIPGAQFLASIPLFMTFLVMLGVSRLLFGSPGPGLLAILGLASIWWVRNLLGSANVDLALGLCCTCALAAVLIVDRTGSRRWLVVAGVFAGAACSIKYFGLPIAALLALYIAARRRSLPELLGFGIAALLVGGAWYARNWLISGDPLHPTLGNLFGHYLWTAADLASQTATLRSPEGGGHGSGTLALILRPKALVLVLLVALATIVALRRRPELFGISLLVLAYCLFWLATVRANRYLLPVLPAAALMIGSMAAWGCQSVLSILKLRVGKDATDVLQGATIVIAAICAVLAISQASANLQNRDEILATRPGHDAFALADRLRPTFGNRLVHLGFVSATDFFEGEAIGDWFGPGRYRQMLDCPDPNMRAHDCKVIDPARMRRLLARFGASMLVINAKEFDFDEVAYARDFDIVYRGRDGSVLMTTKRSPSQTATADKARA